jgi:hypothetical protein
MKVFFNVFDVGEVSGRFEFLGETFAYRLVPKYIVIVPGRVSNMLSNAYVLEKFYRTKRLRKFKKLLLKHYF